MNERLSRSERHGRSRNTRKGTSPKLDTLTRQAARTKRREVGTIAPSTPLPQETEFPIAIPEMGILEADGQQEPSVQDLPTRKELYPSQRIKFTRWFYNSLVFIFVAIMAALLWWGISLSPWGKSHGM